MKKTVLTSAIAVSLTLPGIAGAADLGQPIYKAPVVVAPFSWTGFYIGGQAGYGWGSSDETFFNGPNAPGFAGTQKYDIKGGVAGGVVGYNYQVNSFVFGVEGEFNWASISGTSGIINYAPNLGDTYDTNVRWYGAAKGRLGYAWDRFLIFGNGGGAWGDVRHRYNAALNGGAANSFSESGTQSGWTAGAGLEYAFAPNWTGRIEYNYFDLGKGSIQYSPIPTTNLSEWKDTFSVMKAGINYKF
jgi:outer membrane immunogenic protein